LPEPTAEPRRATDRRGEVIGSGLTVLMAFQFSFVVVLGKSLLTGGLPFVILAIRFAITAAVLLLLLVTLRRPLLPAPGERLALVLAGTAGYGTEAAFYFAALNHGSAAAITLLFYVYPVIVMLATMAMDRRAPAGKLVAALALAISGSVIVVVAGGGVEVQTLGIILALCCAAAYSAYLIATDRFVKVTSPMTSACWLAGGACAANIAFAAVFGDQVIPATAADWWHVALMGAFTVGAFLAMLAGLQRIGAVRNAIIGVLEPLSVALLAWAFLDEPIRAPIAIGGTLILGGAVLATLVRTTATAEPNV
jgi:drug/metabolite transporter (DMT)-like permease